MQDGAFFAHGPYLCSVTCPQSLQAIGNIKRLLLLVLLTTSQRKADNEYKKGLVRTAEQFVSTKIVQSASPPIRMFSFTDLIVLSRAGSVRGRLHSLLLQLFPQSLRVSWPAIY